MGIKLFVDDIRSEPEGWHLARTITEAIRILATQDVEEVSLDHDISLSVEVNGIHRPFPTEETFEPIAWFILAAREAGQLEELQRVTLHTANSVGAQKMKEILKGHGFEVVISLGKPCNRFEK